MKRAVNIFNFFLLTALTFFANGLYGAEPFSVPQLSGPVVDLANLLDTPTKNRLGLSLRKLLQRGGSQIVVLTVPTIGDLTIEQASIKVVDQWKLGDEKRDDGVLIFVVRDVRRMRIEVGQGLEGDLPDAIASRIINEVMAPLFKEGHYSQGILVGTYEVATKANPDINVAALFSMPSTSRYMEKRNAVATQQREPSIFEYLVFIVICFFLIFTRTGRTILFFLMITSLRGGRGSGGFGGRGGGFSGGGASGGW
ncbi:MAG: TPM domain-containing protein [Bdellovibrionota bacterium]